MRLQRAVIQVMAAATALLAASVEADDHAHAPRSTGRDGAAVFTPGRDPTQALYREECGACHLDYPPGLLPARSWHRIMAGLEQHFGANAGLEPEIRDRLERWLAENAAETDTHPKSRKVLRSLGGEAPLRISEVPYIQRKHHEIRPGDLARSSVKTIADCAACHPAAGRWDFEEEHARRSDRGRRGSDEARRGFELERDRARIHDR